MASGARVTRSIDRTIAGATESHGPKARRSAHGSGSATMILYGITIVGSAFLLFLVQPIVAKQILPWFGGTASVWTVCVVFFQAVLLAGYAYAHALTRASPRTQTRVHVVLLAIGVAGLPIIASPAWKPVGDADPTWRIVGLLAATIGLPYFLLSSTGPLIQRWVATDAAIATPPARVYRLFALSNVGSLVGLLAYPFAIEPYTSLPVQSWAWSAGFVAFALACAACALRRRERPVVAATDAPDEPPAPRPTISRSAFWLVCGALGSMLLLAVTNHITQNIASMPFLWILPLTLYLLSFVVVFEGRQGRGWYVRDAWRAPVAAGVIAMAWAMGAHSGVLSLAVALPIFCAGLFLACVFCHGELAATRPAPAYLTQFYLCLSAGGALGGLFVALVAPKLFDNDWETPIAIVGLALLAVVPVLGRRERRPSDWLWGVPIGGVAAACVLLAGGGATFDALRAHLPAANSGALTAALVAVAAAILAVAAWRRRPVAIVVAMLICTSLYGYRYYRFLSTDTLVATRNFYGSLRVKEMGSGRDRRRELLHGVILHGDQYEAADKHRKPTTYYGPASGIAIALRELRPDEEPIDVAMIGLGAGTLATYGRRGDRYRIYDINPAIVDIAKRQFTYLADSAATMSIAMGDARLSMEREIADARAGRALPPFDVVAVDAFSSDAIPVHLITREALDVFFGRLKPDGVVAFHVSNRFLRLAPVVRQIAEDAGASAIDIVDEPDDDDETSSEWVLVTRNRAFLDNPAVRKAASPIDPIPGLPMWTDRFNNLFKILK